jgi:hypothetical protein
LRGRGGWEGFEFRFLELESLYEILGSNTMGPRRNRLPFNLDFSSPSFLSKGLRQRCCAEGDEWGLEGQFPSGELFYGEDGGGNPVRDTDDLHFLY